VLMCAATPAAARVAKVTIDHRCALMTEIPRDIRKRATLGTARPAKSFA